MGFRSCWCLERISGGLRDIGRGFLLKRKKQFWQAGGKKFLVENYCFIFRHFGRILLDIDKVTFKFRRYNEIVKNADESIKFNDFCNTNDDDKKLA